MVSGVGLSDLVSDSPFSDWWQIRMMTKRSLRSRLISIFILTSTVPLLCVGIFLSYNTVHLMRENTRKLTRQNLKQVDDNIGLMLDSYEDLVYQIYTDDDVVKWMNGLNTDEDEAITTNQLRRYMNALLYAKDDIGAITVISDSGKMVTTHTLKAATYESPWLEHFHMDQQTLYETVSEDNGYHFFPTEYATHFAGEDHYLFHIAHRIIDYRDLKKRCGIVVVSLDEDLLHKALYTGEEKDGGNCSFLIDRDHRVMSGPDRSWIGEVLWEGDDADEKEVSDRIRTLLKNRGIRSPGPFSVYTYQNGEREWTIVNAVSRLSFWQGAWENLLITGMIWLLVFGITVILLRRQTEKLVSSVHTVTDAMKEAAGGDLSVQIPIEDTLPIEIETIANEFNDTLRKLSISREKEKEATNKQQKAELRALEAQINPHFLYNTLDTINWMAIDRDEYDISNAINSLAFILRYAISGYDEEVPVRDEVEWLKRYIYLQQYRMKNRFHSEINMSPEVQDWRIHKLLLQPFVENAVLHGFRQAQEEYCLDIAFREEDGRLKIRIADNGAGFDTSIVERIMRGEPAPAGEKGHIGLENAILRFDMYTGGRGTLRIDSHPGKGTTVLMEFPEKQDRKEPFSEE